MDRCIDTRYFTPDIIHSELTAVLLSSAWYQNRTTQRRAIISENIIMRKHSAVCFPNNTRRSPGKIRLLKL